MRVTPCTTEQLRVTTLASSVPPRPPVPNFRWVIVINATGYNLVTSVTKFVWPWQWKESWFVSVDQVCRNCSLLCLQILNLNVSIHSALSVTISNHQSVFATSLRSRLASFHTDLCTFGLIRNARKILNSVMDISNSTEQYTCMCSANVISRIESG